VFAFKLLDNMSALIATEFVHIVETIRFGISVVCGHLTAATAMN
jgi:hypothetical protein